MPRGTLHDPDTELDWIDFYDPANDAQLWRVNLSFMLSTYHCIFTGKPGTHSCPGMLNHGVSYVTGCCERGVMFEGESDYENVAHQVTRLTSEDWDFAETHKENWARLNNGKPYMTKKLRGRCIFANSGEGSASGPGCAFHLLADRLGESYTDTKPNICWTFPIYLDTNVVTVNRESIVVTTITAFDSDLWGGTDDEEDPTGLGYMGGFCIDVPDAYQSSVPVYKNFHDELLKIMGQDAYDKMCLMIDARKDNYIAPMPGAVRNEGRPLLPLLIEKYGERDYLKDLKKARNAQKAES